MTAHTNYLPEPFVLQMEKMRPRKQSHGKKVYGKRQSDKEPRYSGPVLALRGRLSQSKTELWDATNTFMNDNNHFKYGESHSAQPEEGGESMQGWTSFSQTWNLAAFQTRETRIEQGRCQLRSLKSYKLEKALGPKPPMHISPSY